MSGLIRTLGAASVWLLLSVTANAAAGTGQPLVDTGWLSANLGDESVVVVDIRAPVQGVDVYAEGHVPGAVHAPYGSFGWRSNVDGVPGQLPPVDVIAGRIASLGIGNDTHVVIVPFGQNSSDFGSATRVYWTFKVLGHDAVSILDGGVEAWKREGGALDKTAVVPVAADFTASFRPQLIANADDVAAARARGVPLIDARPAAQFSGQQKSPVARVAGTIPGAINIEQSRFYDAGKLSFVGHDQIAALAEEAGIGTDAEEITFCNTGHWASVAWFGLSEVLGNENTAMYDGSMADWTSDESRPVQ